MEIKEGRKEREDQTKRERKKALKRRIKGEEKKLCEKEVE